MESKQSDKEVSNKSEKNSSLNIIQKEKDIYKDNQNEKKYENITKKVYPNFTYIGQMDKGKMIGVGSTYLNNGEKYIGERKNNKKDGNGIYYLKDGHIYKGEFKANKRNGFGILNFKSGNNYIGEFNNGINEGI